jgi:hypothetical protein
MIFSLAMQSAAARTLSRVPRAPNAGQLVTRGFASAFHRPLEIEIPTSLTPAASLGYPLVNRTRTASAGLIICADLPPITVLPP